MRPAEVNAVLLATEAKALFEEAGDELRSGWLRLELEGYLGHVDARPLAAVLRVQASDPVGSRLVAHITAYRTQRGYNVTPGQPRQELRHFFVEPLAELAATAQKLIGAAAAPAVVLSLAEAGQAHSVEFSHDVFARVLAGFGAALHLQLGELAK